MSNLNPNRPVQQDEVSRPYPSDAAFAADKKIYTAAQEKEMADKAATANSRQVGGDHYKTGGEEHWDRVKRLGLDYFQGQITKYVERCWKKNGMQDLEKARHFLDKYMELHRCSPASTAMRTEFSDLQTSILGLGSVEVEMVAEDLLATAFDPMRHFSTARFCFEGIKEGRVHYRCRKCRTHIHIMLAQLPQDVHVFCNQDTGRPAACGYVGQGED